MISWALLVFGLFACFKNGESQLTWTTPTSATATATGTLTSVVEQGGESSAKALTGLKVVAVSSGKDIVSYTIEENSYGIFAVSISSAEGQIQLAADKALDYEWATSYVFKVKATDNTATPLLGTATVTLAITNTDTEDPTWPSLHYCAVLEDNAAVGSAVVTTTATLSSGTSTIGYAVDSTVFEITDGVIKVKSGATIDRSLMSSYSFAATALVTSALTSSTQVSICVGSSTQCAGYCATTCSSAEAITVNIMAILSLLLLLVVKN